MPRKYLFGTRRYFGGQFVDFDSDFRDDCAELCGSMTSDTNVRGVAVPAGSFLHFMHDDGTYSVVTTAPITVFNYTLPPETQIEFPTRRWRHVLGAFLFGEPESYGPFWKAWLVVCIVLALVLLPISYGVMTWRHARWAKVTVPGPTPVGNLLAEPDRPVEISWSGQVRYFVAPWNAIPKALAVASKREGDAP